MFDFLFNVSDTLGTNVSTDFPTEMLGIASSAFTAPLVNWVPTTPKWRLLDCVSISSWNEDNDTVSTDGAHWLYSPELLGSSCRAIQEPLRKA